MSIEFTFVLVGPVFRSAPISSRHSSCHGSSKLHQRQLLLSPASPGFLRQLFLQRHPLVRPIGVEGNNCSVQSDYLLRNAQRKLLIRSAKAGFSPYGDRLISRDYENCRLWNRSVVFSDLAHYRTDFRGYLSSLPPESCGQM